MDEYPVPLADLRAACAERRLEPLERQVDAAVAAMPHWQRALFRVVVAVRRRLP